MRKLSVSYLQSEASKSLFLMACFLVLAVNASSAVVWLAWNGSYLAAIALSVPAAIFWKNAIREAKRAGMLFTAASR